MTILRWWLALISIACGISIAVSPFIWHDVREFYVLRMAVAEALAVGLGWLSYRLTLRGGFGAPGSPRGGRVLSASVDGFLVFSLLSFAANTNLVLFRRYNLDPTFSWPHLLPTMFVANSLWELLISRSGRSLVLWTSSVILFDGFLGALSGLVLSPFRCLPKSRMVIIVTEGLLFAVYWFALAKWLQLRC